MSLENLLAHALMKGCGTDLETVKASSRYQEVLGERRQPLTDPDLVTARAAGYADFGALLNNLSEQQALAQAGSSSQVPNPEVEALLQVTGELLIATATEALPESLIMAANLWHKAKTVEDQIDVVRYIYQRVTKLAATTTNRTGDTTDDDEGEDEESSYLWLAQLEIEYPVEKVLPAQWGEVPGWPIPPQLLRHGDHVGRSRMALRDGGPLSVADHFS